jgi:hypothetical protein
MILSFLFTMKETVLYCKEGGLETPTFQKNTLDLHSNLRGLGGFRNDK